MTDLSKIPELELRQKIKPINDRMDAITIQMDEIREKHRAAAHDALVPLNSEWDKLQGELAEKLGDDREIVGTCDKTGLPIFSDDETKELLVLCEAA